MKTKKNIFINALLVFSALILFSCAKENKEPDLSPVDAEFIMPDAPLITPDQATTIREIVIEYNNAVAD